MNVLQSPCEVSQAWNPASGGQQPPWRTFTALWDTGATGSVITQAVIDACGLVATGIAQVHHAQGSSQAETYLVNIGLPNKVAFSGVRATKGILTGGPDILIGMNIINEGDFAVTNLNRVTKFSFRFPSTAHIDFVADTNRPQFQHGGRPKPKRPKLRPLDRGKKSKKKR